MKFIWIASSLAKEPVAYINAQDNLIIKVQEYENVVQFGVSGVDIRHLYDQGEWEPFDEGVKQHFFEGDKLTIEF